MIVEKEDLGLSLSMSFPEKMATSFIHVNLVTTSPPFPFSTINKTSCTETIYSSDRTSDTCSPETRSFLKGIDVNLLPASTAEAEAEAEEGGISSPNSTISSISGKRSERETTASDEHDLDRDCSRGICDEEDDDDTSRKKLRLSKDQSAMLEDNFKEHNTLNPKQKQALAKRLGLRARQVEVWFQNRRARTKLKQTEVDCEILKRCCENLTEENRRLQKEVQELRALKISPQLYMQMAPPTTLTMCPSCERVAVPPAQSLTVQLATQVNPRPIQTSTPAKPQPIMYNPWAATPIPHRTFDALHSRC